MLCCTKPQYYRENISSLHEDIIKYYVHIYDETNKNDVIHLENITVNKARNILFFLSRRNSYFYVKNVHDDKLYTSNKEQIDRIMQLNIHRGIKFFSNTVRYNLLLSCLEDIVGNICYKNKTNQGYGFLGTNKNNYIAKIRQVLP